MFLVLSILAYAVGLLQPDHFLPWMSWHSEAAAFLAAILLVIYFYQKKSILSKRYIEVSWPSLFLVFLVFLVFLQMSLGVIEFFGDAVVYGLYIGVGFFVVIAGRSALGLGRGAVGGADLILAIYSILFLSVAVVSSLISFSQVLGVDDAFNLILHPLQARRPGANMGQPNHLSTLIAMGYLGWYFCLWKRFFGKAVGAFLLLILTMAIVVTESRTGILIIFALSAFWSVKSCTVKNKNDYSLVVAYLILLLILFYLWPKLFSFYQNGGLSSEWFSEQPNIKIGTRFIIWPQLIEAAMQRPFFGWGFGGVSRAHNAVLDRHLIGEPFTYAHNFFLDLLIGFGFPLTVLLIGFLVCYFGSINKKIKEQRHWFLFAFLIPLAIHSLLEFPFAYAYFLFPWLFLVGVVDAEFNSKALFRIQRIFYAPVFSVMLVLLLWSVFEYTEIEADFRFARFEAANIGEVPNAYVAPNIFLLTQMSSLLVVARSQPHPGMSLSEIEQMRKVALRFPWTATQNRYALTLALNGHTFEAKRQLEVMRVMHGFETHKRLMEYWDYQSKTKYPELRRVMQP